MSRELPIAPEPSWLASSTRITTPDHRTGASARRCGEVARAQRRSRMKRTIATTPMPSSDIVASSTLRSVSLLPTSSADSGQPSHCMSSLKPHSSWGTIPNSVRK